MGHNVCPCSWLQSDSFLSAPHGSSIHKRYGSMAMCWGRAYQLCFSPSSFQPSPSPKNSRPSLLHQPTESLWFYTTVFFQTYYCFLSSRSHPTSNRTYLLYSLLVPSFAAFFCPLSARLEPQNIGLTSGCQCSELTAAHPLLHPHSMLPIFCFTPCLAGCSWFLFILFFFSLFNPLYHQPSLGYTRDCPIHWTAGSHLV